jgi:hypothetical protein
MTIAEVKPSFVVLFIAIHVYFDAVPNTIDVAST